MLWLSDLLGTFKSTFGVGKATIASGGLSLARTYTLPDKSGTVAMTSDLGSGVATEVTLNFGTKWVNAKKFSITDAGALTTHKIVMVPSAKPVSGRQADEQEFIGLACACRIVVNGTIEAYISCYPNEVNGSYIFNYTLNT